MPARSWHCDNCEVSWPYTGNWQDCGVCGERCAASTNAPLDQDDAEELKKEARLDRAAAIERRKKYEAFEKHYAERELAAFQEELDTWLTAQL